MSAKPHRRHCMLHLGCYYHDLREISVPYPLLARPRPFPHSHGQRQPWAAAFSFPGIKSKREGQFTTPASFTIYFIYLVLGSARYGCDGVLGYNRSIIK